MIYRFSFAAGDRLMGTQLHYTRLALIKIISLSSVSDFGKTQP